jgi:hypothetical protein
VGLEMPEDKRCDYVPVTYTSTTGTNERLHDKIMPTAVVAYAVQMENPQPSTIVTTWADCYKKDGVRDEVEICRLLVAVMDTLVFDENLPDVLESLSIRADDEILKSIAKVLRWVLRKDNVESQI